MSCPRTTAGILAHLESAGCIFDITQFEKLSLSDPVPSLTHDFACMLTLVDARGQAAKFHLDLTITSRAMQIRIPWVTQRRQVEIDHILGSSLAYDKLLFGIAKTIYRTWDDEVFPGSRELIDRDGYEVGPFRFGKEYRPLGSPGVSVLSSRINLTAFRVLASERGSKRAAREAICRIHGLSSQEANGWFRDLTTRRSEYFSREPGFAYRLTSRGYELLAALEARYGEDLPWPL